MDSQRDFQAMFDYLRDDIKELRDDVKGMSEKSNAKIDALRDELRNEIRTISSTLQAHTDSDTANFEAINQRLAGESAVLSFKDKVFNRTNGWLIAIGAIGLLLLEYFHKG